MTKRKHDSTPEGPIPPEINVNSTLSGPVKRLKNAGLNSVDTLFRCDCPLPQDVGPLCSRCEKFDWARWLQKAHQNTLYQSLSWPSPLGPDCATCFAIRKKRNELDIDYFEALSVQPYRQRDINTLDTPVVELEFMSKQRGRRHLIPVHQGPGLAGRHISIDSVDYVTIRKWLQHCESTHTDCAGFAKRSLVGFRGIDVMKLAVVDLPVDEPYATLSYVWGDPVEEEMGPSGLPASLPRTISDAIVVARELGYRYLWVDRYCIPQDDKDARHGQIRMMDELYSGSSLTIIAAAGKDANHGLPGVSRPREKQALLRTNGHCLIVVDSAVEEVESSTWNTRGWTYQEALLSKRKLVFTVSRTYFQCCQLNINEDISFPLDQIQKEEDIMNGYSAIFPPVFRLLPQIGGSSRLKAHWRLSHDISAQIDGYLRRTLTFDTDAINAVSGILKMYDRPSFVGLPLIMKTGDTKMEDFARTICWHGSGSLVRRECFPSWSWAGWKVPADSQVTKSLLFEVSTPLRAGLESVTAQYGDESPLDWETDFTKVIARSDLGIYPKHVLLSGWTFRFEVSKAHWDGKELIPRQLELDDPVEGRRSLHDISDMGGIYESVAEVRKNFIGLIVGCSPIDRNSQDKVRKKAPGFSARWIVLTYLLLRWQGGHFERHDTIGSTNVYAQTSYVHGKWYPVIPGVSLEWRKVRLG